MSWTESSLVQLAETPRCGYRIAGPVCAEPTALTALALIAHGRNQDAGPALAWLADRQSPEGSVGISREHARPRWPTALCLLAWLADDRAKLQSGNQPEWSTCIESGLHWLLSIRGAVIEEASYVGHDTRLSAWPWVEGTHSWIEPSSFSLLALKLAGKGNEPRAREAARLLLDRQLASGGCNYGNSEILGRQLRPHVQPTGLSLVALAGEEDLDGRLERSLAYLRRHLTPRTSLVSLAWGLLGLAAHGDMERRAETRLAEAERRAQRVVESPYKRALAVLACKLNDSPLFAANRSPTYEIRT